MPTMTHVVLALWMAMATPDPAALEKEAKAIEALLIAPCCWSQQVSVHQSPVTDEIRQNIRKLLNDGKTRQQIVDAYVSEYGDRVLAEPPARGFNRLFYVGPWLFLFASIGLVFVVIRRLRTPAAAAAAPEPAARPTEDESDRIDEELRNLD